MLFNSWEYLLFLPTVLGLFWVVPRKIRAPLLLVASCVFYAWWDYRFLSLIIISTVVDFVVARRMRPQTRAVVRKRLLLASVLVNLGILGFFKYWGFFVNSTAGALASLGLGANLPVLQVVLPVGISFYTFQTMSYTIDVYRGRFEPEPDFIRFALFVCFFPQLVAGPIERAEHLLPQIRRLGDGRPSSDWSRGLQLIVRGLFRKIVIADGVSSIVNEVFASPTSYGGVTLAVGIVAFSLQIYGDFAGYTDVARGSAKLFGVDLMENFRVPYRAEGFSDFWRRWHISLSTWLQDYLYIPLGGNRGSRLETIRNLMITMLLGGLWHGAGWGFVIWGGLHGVYLVVERVRAWAVGRRPRFPTWLVFVIVSLTWVPFRAASFSSALSVWLGLLDPFGKSQLTFAPVAVVLLGLVSYTLDSAVLAGRLNPIGERPPLLRGAVYAFGVLLLLLFWPLTSSPFIYFQF